MARHTLQFKVPLVGNQQVTLTVHDKTRASVLLDGIVRCTGGVTYAFDDDGKVQFTMDETLRRFMDRYGCTASEGRYDALEDVAYITIRLRLLAIKRQLRLERTPSSCSVIDPIFRRLQRGRGTFRATERGFETRLTPRDECPD